MSALHRFFNPMNATPGRASPAWRSSARFRRVLLARSSGHRRAEQRRQSRVAGIL